MKRYASSTGCAGFTLLELLVALAIFGLLATMSYSGLRVVLEQQAGTEIEAERLGELQKIYLLMQRDLEQVVPRPVRDEFGDQRPALLGGDSLELTRGGWNNPAGRLRSTLQRVGYNHEDQQLVRYIWSVLDRAQDSEPIRQPLAENIEELQIRYLGENNEWQDEWPEAKAAGGGAEVEPPPVPKAVEVSIDHEHYGLLVWLFQLPR